jgi:hypothetical protein
MASTSFRGEKLIGKSNFIEWFQDARLFLEINGYMPYIDKSESPPDIKLYYNGSGNPKSAELGVKYAEKFSKYTRNSKKALGALKSIISHENCKRFRDKQTPYDLWGAISTTFAESTLENLGRYFNKILEADYDSFENIDQYTSQIQSSSIYLKELHYELLKPYIVLLLFKGLLSSFESFISRKYKEITKNLGKVDISKLISELIAEEARINSSLNSLEAQRANKTTKFFKKNKVPYCKFCKTKGHLESKCFHKFPELKKGKGKAKDYSTNE